MALELLFKRKSSGKIGALVLDATITESQSFRNEVTEFPVESGSKISDHVIQSPEEITIEGYVTNTPIEQLDANGFPKGLSLTSNPLSDVVVDAMNALQTDRVTNAYLALLDLAGYQYPQQIYKRTWEGQQLVDTSAVTSNTNKKQGTLPLVKLITNYRTYDNMALVNLTIPSDAETGESVKFSASFRRIKLVDLQRMSRTPNKTDTEKKKGAKNASNKKNNGNNPTTTQPKLKSSAWEDIKGVKTAGGK